MKRIKFPAQHSLPVIACWPNTTHCRYCSRFDKISSGGGRLGKIFFTVPCKLPKVAAEQLMRLFFGIDASKPLLQRGIF